jgi:hypothetical protein
MASSFRILETSLIAGVVGLAIGVLNEFLQTDDVKVKQWTFRLSPHPDAFGTDEELARAFYHLQSYRQYNEKMFVQAILVANDLCFLYHQIREGKVALDPEQDEDAAQEKITLCHEFISALLESVLKTEEDQFNARERAREQSEHDHKAWVEEREHLTRAARETRRRNRGYTVPGDDDDMGDNTTVATNNVAIEPRSLAPEPKKPEAVHLKYDTAYKCLYIILHRLIQYAMWIKNEAQEHRKQLIRDQVAQEQGGGSASPTGGQLGNAGT